MHDLSARQHEDRSRPGPLLPPELPWVLLVVPLPAAYLMGHDLLDKSLPLLVRSLVKMYLPFITFGATFLLVYRYGMPGLLRRITAPSARAVMHVAVILGIVVVMSPPLHRVLERLCGLSGGLLGFTIVSLIFSAACLLPALTVQGLRLRARSAEHRALIERQTALEAQLQALQARTDPHFLFNSLNTVASLIPEDPVLAERTLERLSDLFRYALESGRLRTVRLERELRMVSDYLELQETRFGERLQTRLEVASGLDDVLVPPLLLQPLVENAILHGTSRRQGARVDVAVRREKDQLIIEVSDDGPGPGQSLHVGAGTSVRGLAERLRLHYDERAQLSLEANPKGGCLAKLALPIAAPV